MATCRVNFYGDLSTHLCKSCAPFCRECTGQSFPECTRCVDGRFMTPNECVDTCPASHYGVPYSEGPPVIQSSCQQCDTSCLECNGGLATECTSCHPGFSLNSVSEGECISVSCATNEYLSGGICKSCHGSCATCDESTENDCLSCSMSSIPPAEDLFLDGQKCLTVCPVRKFAALPSHTCEDCAAHCDECSGSGLD